MPQLEFAARSLTEWTPYLAGGFMWNIAISIAALRVSQQATSI